MTAPEGEQTGRARWRRRAILATLATGGAQATQRLWHLSQPERAALSSRRPRHLPPNPTLVFAIPLVGKHQVSDWSIIETALARTLASLARQTRTDYRVMLCGQDRPDCLPEDDKHRFISFTQAVEGHDKVPKLKVLASALPELGIEAGLYLPFDGDDLVARDFIERVQRVASGGGALVESGLIRNVATGAIGRTAPRSLAKPLQKPFWKFCGSCAAFGFEVDAEGKDIAFFQGLAEHEHRLYPYLATLAGLRLAPLRDAPAVLYEINHGENFETRRGRGGFKQRFVERFQVDDPTDLAEVAALFPEAGVL